MFNLLYSFIKSKDHTGTYLIVYKKEDSTEYKDKIMNIKKVK